MPTVAVLFQAIDPPIINGVRKPRKPGGELSPKLTNKYIPPYNHTITETD
jgi:hypothetical protein